MEPLLIDLSNNFFLVKLSRKGEYERALLDCPWMIGGNYLHVQRWRPNFVSEKEEITSLPVWVWFPIFLVEYYSERWLRKGGHNIRETIKVGATMLVASRDKFAQVCDEVDLQKSLKSG